MRNRPAIVFLLDDWSRSLRTWREEGAQQIESYAQEAKTIWKDESERDAQPLAKEFQLGSSGQCDRASYGL